MPVTSKRDSLQLKLASLNACDEAREWAKQFKTAAEAWEKCTNPAWMLWTLEAVGWKNDSLLRKVACWCARDTPLKDGRKTWDLLTDPRSRTAIEVAERFADGKATQEELDAAWDAAQAAAQAAACAAQAAACAAQAAACAAQAAACAAWDAAQAAACAAQAAACAAWDAAQAAQAKAIRKIVGNPFKGKNAVKV